MISSSTASQCDVVVKSPGISPYGAAATALESAGVREEAPGSLFSTSTIVATAFIGSGNQVFLRGEGAGLSWRKGVPMRIEVGPKDIANQKLVVVRHRDDPSRDVAYVGGIDLCELLPAFGDR